MMIQADHSLQPQDITSLKANTSEIKCETPPPPPPPGIFNLQNFKVLAQEHKDVLDGAVRTDAWYMQAEAMASQMPHHGQLWSQISISVTALVLCPEGGSHIILDTHDLLCSG